MVYCVKCRCSRMRTWTWIPSTHGKGWLRRTLESHPVLGCFKQEDPWCLLASPASLIGKFWVYWEEAGEKGGRQLFSALQTHVFMNTHTHMYSWTHTNGKRSEARCGYGASYLYLGGRGKGSALHLGPAWATEYDPIPNNQWEKQTGNKNTINMWVWFWKYLESWVMRTWLDFPELMWRQIEKYESVFLVLLFQDAKRQNF